MGQTHAVSSSAFCKLNRPGTRKTQRHKETLQITIFVFRLWSLFMLPLPVRTCCIAFIDTRSRPRQFVTARPRIFHDVQTRVVIEPIDKAVLEDWIRSGDALWNGHGIAHLARRLRYR